MGIASKELREKAVAAYRTNRYTQQELADVYGVHAKTIANWVKIAERTKIYSIGTRS